LLFLFVGLDELTLDVKDLCPIRPFFYIYFHFPILFPDHLFVSSFCAVFFRSSFLPNSSIEIVALCYIILCSLQLYL
jgi:hypothetical protein